MPPTNKDVARLAGVSIATVSRVVNDSPNVRPRVRRKVLRAIKELNYQPSRTAQRLRIRNSKVLGLIISDIQNPFFTSVARGIEDLAYEHGYSVVLCNSDENPEKEKLYIDVMRAEGVAGVILASTRERNPEIRALLEHGIPVVALDRHIQNKRVDTVRVANVDGACEAVTHLFELGHRNIGFVGLPATLTTGREREEGYIQAHHRAGVRLQRALMRVGDGKQASGYKCARELLALSPRPSALFVTNNLMTLGALAAIRESHLDIPADISIVGFDDMPWAPLLEPPLTAVAQPTYELGRKAAEILLRRLNHPEEPTAHIFLKPTLIIRESTAPLGAQRATALESPVLRHNRSERTKTARWMAAPTRA